MMNAFKVLVVDDDSHVCESVRELLAEQGFQVAVATSLSQAIQTVEKNPYEFAVAVIDLKLGEQDGLQLVEKVIKLNSDIAVAIYSGYGSVENVKQTFKAGAVDFIEKGGNRLDLLSTIKSLYNKFEETRSVTPFQPNTANEKLISLSGMVGRSNEMVEVVKAIFKFKSSDATVLIEGENGTGKDLAAKAVYQNSGRKNKPFVAVNLAAVNDGTEESELFGHVKGAFTSAIKDKKGLFEMANGGTLFLDEVGEAKPSLQAKLLRVLQDGTFIPVGSELSRQVDVRVIAATNRDLKKMVKSGLFREDLYYRLNVLNIRVPALRERTEDIEPLVSFFSQKLSERTGVKKRFLVRTIKQMEKYPWPGNIRELENMVENLWVMCDEPKIEPRHLDGKFFQKQEDGQNLPIVSTWQDFESWIRNKKIEFINQKLSQSRNKSEAAAKLGLPPSSLHHIMKIIGMYSNDNSEVS